jgi:hypothetical protein
MVSQQTFEDQLLGPRDLDPGRWRSLIYKVDIDVGKINQQIGDGSITTIEIPYWLVRITHQIVGAVNSWEAMDDGTSGDPSFQQDGQYSIEWKDERSVYTAGQPDGFIMPDAAFGSVRTGHLNLLPRPLFYAGRNVHSFRVKNEILRVLPPDDKAEYFRVQIQLHGFADWGVAKKG